MLLRAIITFIAANQLKAVHLIKPIIVTSQLMAFGWLIFLLTHSIEWLIGLVAEYKLYNHLLVPNAPAPSLEEGARAEKWIYVFFVAAMLLTIAINNTLQCNSYKTKILNWAVIIAITLGAFLVCTIYFYSNWYV
jgi:hypothetical protein